MFEKVRILPILIVSAIVLFGLKVEDIWRNAGEFNFTRAHAQGDDAVKKPNDPGAIPTKKSEAGKMAKKQTAALNANNANPEPLDVNKLTPAEIQLLQSLGKRRDEIEKRSKQLEIREAILAATEKRIDGKITSLKELEAKVQDLIKSHDEQSEKRLRRLVKVYENMKPKAAARIFEKLEMAVLIDVTQRMREAKMAAVLANMNTEKARELTVRLANLGKLPENGG